MQAVAQVLRVEEGRVRLRVSDMGGGCGRCDEPGGCRSLQIARVFGRSKAEFVLPTELLLQAGDTVLVSIPDGSPLKAAMASYGLGAVLLMAGAALGSVAAGQEGADFGAACGALAGLALAFAANRLLFRSRGWRSRLSMEVLPLPRPHQNASQAACLQSLQEPR
ncbi:SoxR reducing system RseC family protein [Thauera sp.]|uniref:SoxR reducing system RseC family protein n=1 Tax=Thauera sp. TaxID=1905334 RepID=UPI0039E70943